MRLIVEAAFGSTVVSANPAWTEITQFVDCVNFGMRNERGAPDEKSETQPGTLTLTLTNSDGRFTPGYPGPYSPNVKKNTPLRVRVVSAAKNLITNPSFEPGFTDWTKTASPTVVVDATHVQDGAQAVRITWGAPSGQSIFTEVYGLDIGQTYTVSAYVWIPTGAPAMEAHIEGMPSGTPSAVNDAFTRITYTFTATAPHHRAVLQVVGSPTVGTQAWVDAVQLEEGSTATPFDPTGAQIHPRFAGMVNEWPVRWDGLHSTVTITATDMFKRLARTPGAATSSLRAMLVEEVLLDKPYAYYPMSEPDGSTNCGDLASRGAQATTVNQGGSGGSINFGTGAGPNDSLGCVVFNPVNFNNGQYFHADLGPQLEQASNTQTLKVECWFKTTLNSRTLFTLRSVNLAFQMLFRLENPGGQLQIENYGETENLVTYATGNLADGQVHHLLYDEADKRVYIDGVDKGQQTSVPGSFAVRLARIGGYANQGVWTGEIAHFAVYADNALTAAAVLQHQACGTTLFSGEAGNTRIARLASYLGLTSITSQGITFSPVGGQKALGNSALEHMREVERAESGKLLGRRDTPGLLFQARDVRYNTAPAFSLAYYQLETDDGEMSDDDQKLINIVEASRDGGATQRVIDQASIDTYGPYPIQLELIKASDNEVIDAANWTISRYKDPPPELREITVDGYSLPLATYRALLNADVSTTFDVTGLPAEAPASTQTVVIEGYTETMREGSHVFNFHVSRASTDTVWILDSPSYSQLGTTTKLAY
ncbi:LamG-like jellyroll fold domain-containing protein [Streptomyces sp. NPDC001982]|uniref:phage head spike fiber domain-containing protein n=1 Tax=Streptomyces sp. NPDC001982 TaxID=3154405 RepID=UPI00331CC970